MPTKFRKKPVTVEAVQWDGHNLAEMSDFTRGKFRRRPQPVGSTPDMRGEVFDALHDTWVTVHPGQWVIKGVKGEVYPIAEDVLAETYELVTTQEPPQ